MSDVVIVALIVLAGQMITLFVTSWNQHKTQASITTVASKVEEVRHHTNSLVEAAVSSAKAVGIGEGIAQERQDQRDREDELGRIARR